MSLFDPQTWVQFGALFQDDPLNFFPKDSVRRGMIYRKTLKSIDVYRYLKARFGLPQGPMTMIKDRYSVDNIVHWDYQLVADDGTRLVVQGAFRHVEIYVSREMSEEDWRTLAESIKSDFRNHGKAMSEIARQLEKWDVLTNRYSIIADNCATQHEVLSENIQRPENRSAGFDDVDEIKTRIDAIAERNSVVFGASVALETLMPVMAEAYINLIAFLLMNKDTRDNERLRSNFIRENIDIKLMDFHLRCDGFRSAVDIKSPEFTNFMSIMNKRNDHIHGNVNPQRDFVETAFFDNRYTPLYEGGEDPLVSFFDYQESVYRPSDVLERYLGVHEFLIYLRSLLEPKYRHLVDNISMAPTFGKLHGEHKFGVLSSPLIRSTSVWLPTDEGWK